MRRAVKDGAGNVLQRIDYYPFGSVSADWSSSTTPAQSTIRYRFSGKEIAGQRVGASAPAGTPVHLVIAPETVFKCRIWSNLLVVFQCFLFDELPVADDGEFLGLALAGIDDAHDGKDEDGHAADREDPADKLDVPE